MRTCAGRQCPRVMFMHLFCAVELYFVSALFQIPQNLFVIVFWLAHPRQRFSILAIVARFKISSGTLPGCTGTCVNVVLLMHIMCTRYCNPVFENSQKSTSDFNVWQIFSMLILIFEPGTISGINICCGSGWIRIVCWSGLRMDSGSGLFMGQDGPWVRSLYIQYDKFVAWTNWTIWRLYLNCFVTMHPLNLSVGSLL